MICLNAENGDVCLYGGLNSPQGLSPCVPLNKQTGSKGAEGAAGHLHIVNTLYAICEALCCCSSTSRDFYGNPVSCILRSLHLSSDLLPFSPPGSNVSHLAISHKIHSVAPTCLLSWAEERNCRLLNSTRLPRTITHTHHNVEPLLMTCVHPRWNG